MKLKLSPTRVSFLALGAFAAVVAQELARSDAKTPSATPPNSGTQKASRTLPTTAPLPNSIALSQPESLFSAATVPNPSGMAQPQTPAIVPPASPKIAPTSTPEIVDVSQLPIDTIIEQTLKLPPPPLMIALPSSTDKKPAVPKAPTATSETSTALKDIQGHRAQASILALAQQGIMKGYDDGTFRPNAPITDAQFRSVTKQAAKQVTTISTLQRPKDIVTRADAAMYIHRQLQRANSANPTLVAANPTESAPLPKLASSNPTQLLNSSAPSRPLPPATPPLPAAISNPEADVADDDSYTLGAGDRIRIDVFNVPEYSKEYQVLVNGTINLQRVGSISVRGMTIRQAQDAIATKYRRVLRNPSLDVSLLAARPLNVAIAGEVGKPGTYSLAFSDGGKFPTITKLIREAGGMSRSADARQVVVRRPQRGGGEQQIRLDMWELFTTGNIRQDLTLRDGDSIFIPAARSINLAEAAQMADANFSVASNQPVNVAIVGEVARPGPYTIKDQIPTLSAAIREAGGIKQLANLKEVKVRRNTRGGTAQTINVDLWQLIRSGDLNQDLVLQQGDSIEIPTALALNSEEARQLGDASFAPSSVKITVVGEVTKPGQVEVPMNTPLNQALLQAGGFTRQANRRRVELVRLNPNGSVTRRDVSIDLSRGIDEKGNPLLQNGDVLVVDRSGLAKTGDTIQNVLGPVLQVLPFRFLFGL